MWAYRERKESSSESAGTEGSRSRSLTSGSSDNGEEESDRTVDYSDNGSSSYITTYSEDERIVQYIKNKREQEQEEARELENERAAEFEAYYESHKDSPTSIFNLPGISFIHFRSNRIKFSFQPCRVARCVSSRVMFFISLKHRKGFWLLKRDSLPANYKMRVYPLFYTERGFRYQDEDVDVAVFEIWKVLKEWAEAEHNFRLEKFQRYQNGEDVYIDTDDEDLFLDDAEVEELHAKREAIWRRMLPPTFRLRQRRR